MATDPTLDIDLSESLAESRRLADTIKPGSGQWDVIVVGSGAAGGMAAFQLATAGIKVLMLEAGRMLDHRREYRTMEWPYASPRRHRVPPDHRPIAVAEYNFLDRPYASNPQMAKYAKVTSYAGNTFTRNWVVNERDNPTTGTPYAWVRARVLGGILRPERAADVRAAGADAVIDMSAPDLHDSLRKQVYAATQDRGADIVLDIGLRGCGESTADERQRGQRAHCDFLHVFPL